MLRTAAAFAALSLSAGLTLSPMIAQAEPEGSASAAFRLGHAAAPDDAAVRVSHDRPADASLVNPRNGKVITLEMVKNDAEWQEETAEMLQRDQTSEAPE